MNPTDRELRDYLLRLLNPAGSNQLGFHHKRSRARYDYIYIKAEDNGPGVWYRLEGEDRDTRKPVYIDENHFTGYLIEVTMVEVATEKYGTTLKIDLIFAGIDGAIPTIIRSGATTFMEGLLRPLMSAEAIRNPITVAATRAEKSEKAVFGDVEMDGDLLIQAKGMPRLITWEGGDKPRRNEVLATFLPAVNNIRAKLGLEPLLEPVDRQALDEATRNQSSPKTAIGDIEIVPITDLSDQDLSVKCFEIIKALGYNEGDGSQAVAFLKATVGSTKFSAMDRSGKEAVATALYRKLADAVMEG
jgi:hypothetical protein